MNAVFLISLWVTNSIFFYLAFLLWPSAVVLGNNIRSPIVASMLSGFLLTVVVALAPPIMRLTGLKIKEESKQALFYLIFNVVGIWLIARLATFTGFGVVSFWVAVALGIVVNFLQWGVWKTTLKKTK